MAALVSKKGPICVLGGAQEVLCHGNLVLGVIPR